MIVQIGCIGPWRANKSASRCILMIDPPHTDHFFWILSGRQQRQPRQLRQLSDKYKPNMCSRLQQKEQNIFLVCFFMYRILMILQSKTTLRQIWFAIFFFSFTLILKFLKMVPSAPLCTLCTVGKIDMILKECTLKAPFLWNSHSVPQSEMGLMKSKKNFEILSAR